MQFAISEASSPTTTRSVEMSTIKYVCNIKGRSQQNLLHTSQTQVAGSNELPYSINASTT